MAIPQELMANCWTGRSQGNRSLLEKPRARAWAMRKRVDPGKTLQLAADEPPDLRDWQDPRVGWGLILPENENLPTQKRALAEDAPEPIRRLWEKRGKGPVFRYRANRDAGTIRRYATDGTARDPRINETEEGVDDKQIPRYLLICGSPAEIPWEFQYELNLAAYVGRLDLDEAGLDHYVTALLDNWSGSDARSSHPVVWSVDHGGGDITRLMRKSIAELVAAKFQSDGDIEPALQDGLLFDDKADGKTLGETLADRKPTFVLTTSHGMTAPLDDPAEMAKTLGVPVDREHQPLDLDSLLEQWSPAGAVWYAHACCGAGSSKDSAYLGLFPDAATLNRLFGQIAAIGSVSSPLPRRLLSCKTPLRAFIGHVEPTFDWTIRDPRTSQVLTHSIVNGLYNRLFRRVPETLGMAFEEYYEEVGPLFVQWMNAKSQVAAGTLGEADIALHRNLAALDRQSMVILGDPTVALPPLKR